ETSAEEPSERAPKGMEVDGVGDCSHGYAFLSPVSLHCQVSSEASDVTLNVVYLLDAANGNILATSCLKSPACSCVSITLPASSQTRITASCERLKNFP